MRMKLIHSAMLSMALTFGSGALATEPDFSSLALPRPVEQSEAPIDPAANLLPASSDAPVEPKAPAKTRGELSLNDAGISDGLTITGHQVQTGFNFTLPGDQIVSSAKLTLNVKVSGDLVEGQHYLNLMLNGQDLGQLPLSQAIEKVNHFTIDIPAPMLVSVNNLSMTLEDGKALQCESNSDTRYKLQILPDSKVQYESILLDVAPDMSQLPWPFIDRYEMRRARVNMVFASEPEAATLAAASIVSGWLGIKAGHQGVDLPASTGTLPEGNAIVFGHPGEKIGELTIPEGSGGALWLTNNPAAPQFKLLVVSGHSASELGNAAYFLTHSTLKAESTVTHIGPQKILAREPYDAPRWVDTRHPVQLKQLVDSADKFNAWGVNHDSIRVAFRAAPDLFTWDGETVPVTLNYHFPNGAWLDEGASKLGVSLNGQFIKALPVNKTGSIEMLWHRLGGDTRQEHHTLKIQPWQIYGENQIAFWFSLKPTSDAPCQIYSDTSIKSTLDPASTLDLSHTWHFSELPNLSYFIGAGFPLTRVADLSETVAILPQHPNATEVSVLLMLMARNSAATGLTPHGLHVYLGENTLINNTQLLKEHDVLVVSSVKNREFMSQSLAASPFSLSGNTLAVKPQSLEEKIVHWIGGEWSLQTEIANRYLNSASEWRGFLSFQSPWDASRSVIFATAADDKQLAQLSGDLRQPRINSAIRQDLTVITPNDGVHSWRLGNHYMSGELPWYLRIIWYASQHIVQLGTLCALLAALLGLVVFIYLRNQAEERLSKFTGHRR